MIKIFSLVLLLFTTTSYGVLHQASDEELKTFMELPEVKRLIDNVIHDNTGYNNLNQELKIKARKHVCSGRIKWDAPVYLSESGKKQSADILKVNLLVSKTMTFVYSKNPN